MVSRYVQRSRALRTLTHSLTYLLQAYFQLEKEEAEQIVAAFHSWDVDGDGSLDFDEFREMTAYSNPALPPKTMMKIYKAATPETPDGGSQLNVLKFSQVTRCG